MDQAKKSKSEINEKLESMSEIDKELNDIKSSFYKDYYIWLKQKESSCKHGNLFTDGVSSTRNSSSIKEQPKANRVETESELPDHKIHGFVNDILFLNNYLLKQKESKKFKTLAIVGQYGVGKTTLCQSVFNDAEVKRAYRPRIWVSMFSKETKEDEDPKIDVVKRILRSLGVEDELLERIKTETEEEKRSKDEAGEREDGIVKEKELSRLLNALHLNLIGKKYLIVLDDVSEDSEWNQQEKSNLSCGFPKGFGGRVIVTTRDERLAKKIVGEEENLQRLFPRSDAESIWKIYQDAVEANAGNAEALKVNLRYPGSIKQELMDKSCGVPLAARMLAKIEPVELEQNEGNMDRKKSV
ncbi:putative disease resistance protein [Cardamine amara subsp. amara]|uniref:Disease resistance protein n=1 Tax=Cardamine amara subsp. amara TaxID=228776 RepID=A0ABD1C679_CARAN